jgi:Pyruvate-formate lyase-activating enzyme
MILSLGTFACNLRCKFCQNHHIAQAHLDQDNFQNSIKQIEFVDPEKVIQKCQANNLNLIAFTYNEPTVFMNI